METTEIPLYVVHQSAWRFLAAGSIAALFVITWLYCWFTGTQASEVRTFPFSVFVWAFAAPIGIWMIWLSMQRSPVIAAFPDHLELRSTVYPHRRVELPRDMIRRFSTDWERKTSKRDLIIVVSDGIDELVRESPMWIRKHPPHYHMDIGNLELPPDIIVGQLELWLKSGSPE